MRDIEFRAWNGVDKMINRGLHDRNWYASDNKLIRGCHPRDARTLTVMQYTGIKDSEGNKVFEGDIVKCQYDQEDPSIHKVYWGGTDYPAFELYPLISDDTNGFSELICGDDWVFEVVGNVYENPELLGGDI